MADSSGFHENLAREQEVKSGSERSFGVVFAIVFVIVAVWPLLDGGTVRLWSLGVAALFLAAAYLFPTILRPLNRVWFWIGLVLYKVVNPITMAFIFGLAVVPTGLLMRLFGKRPIPIAFDPSIESYWIKREPPGPEPDSMKNQF